MTEPVYTREIKLKIGDVFLLRTVNQNTVYNWLYNLSRDVQQNLKSQIVNWVKDKFGNIQQLLINQQFSSSKMQIEFLKIFSKITGQEYIQAMMYVGQDWVLYVEKTGSHLIKIDPNVMQKFDIFRCPEEYDENKMFELVKKYWNLEYDSKGFWVGQLGKILKTFKIPPQQVEDLFKYNTPEKLTSQEMIVRMYKEVGVNVFDDLNDEMVLPQDIQEKFIKLI